MNPLPQFRQRISRILGVSIPKEDWEKTIKGQDIQGKVTSRIMLDMIIALCIQMEELLHQTQLDEKPLNPTVPLYNPRQKDFSFDWLDKDNAVHTLFMRSKELTNFPREQANFMQKHLADLIYQERNAKTQEELQGILDEIHVDLGDDE